MDWTSFFTGLGFGIGLTVIWATWLGMRDHAEYIALIDKAIALAERMRQQPEEP